jgi:hypothetical protein
LARARRGAGATAWIVGVAGRGPRHLLGAAVVDVEVAVALLALDPGPVAAPGQPRRQLDPLARGHQPLHRDVVLARWLGRTEVPLRDLADRTVDAEGDLDRVLAIGAEVEQAGLASRRGRQVAQGRHALATSAVRTHDVPRQLEQAGPGRVQAHRQQAILVEAPGPGPLAHLDPPDLELVAGGHEPDQPIDAVAVEALAAQLAGDRVEAGPGVVGQGRRRRRQDRAGRARELAVELGQHPAVVLVQRAEAEAQRRRADRAPRHEPEVGVEPAAVAARLDPLDRVQEPGIAAVVDPHALEPLPGDPAPRHLAPGVDAAAALRPPEALTVLLGEPHLGRAERAVEPRGVAGRAPHRVGRRRQVEGPQELDPLAVAIAARPRV